MKAAEFIAHYTCEESLDDEFCQDCAHPEAPRCPNVEDVETALLGAAQNHLLVLTYKGESP